MNSNALLLVALLGGATGGMNDTIIKALLDSQKENFERWTRLIKSLATILTTGLFVLRGMPTPVDSQGKPTFTNEALSAQIKASFEEGKREAFWVSAVNGIVDVLIEFLRPSATETALLTSLMSRGSMAPTTTIVSQPAATIPALTSVSTTARTAGQVLRRQLPGGFVRAQAVYVNPDTGEIAVE